MARVLGAAARGRAGLGAAAAARAAARGGGAVAGAGAAPAAPAQPPAAGFTEPDQVKRYAAAVEAGNPRVLDIESMYEAGWMKGAHVLVTGANRGIGLSLAQEAVRCGAHVYAACRTVSPELEALKAGAAASGGAVDVLLGLELTDYATCEAVADLLQDAPPLDVVINNAGYFPDGKDDLSAGLAIEENLKQYDICAVGPLRVTAALVRAGRVKAPGGKIINITSQGGSAVWRQVQNSNEGGDYGHHMGKAAANMAGALLAEELRPRGIAVANLHPGFNRTDMTRKYEDIWDIEGAVESEVGAKRVLHEVGRVGLLDSGCPFVNCEDGLLIPY